MGVILIKLPHSLYEMARELAKQESISINQLITLALAEKISTLMAAEYLGKRAKYGKREKFVKALARVADVDAEEKDRL